VKRELALKIDVRSPITIRRQLSEQLKHLIEGGGVPREEALPSIRELAGFLGINPNTVARAVEDLKRSGHVEARRGTGVFVAPMLPVRPAPRLRERLLRDIVMRAAALGMTADDVAVGVLSVATVRPAVVHEALQILLVECSRPELDFFAGQLEDHLPVRVDKVLLGDLATVVRRPKQSAHWRAGVTSFCHLPEVERLLRSRGVPVIALLAEVHLETLHRLAQCPPGTRVGVVSVGETTHNLAHSIANAGLPNIVVAGVCAAEGPALGRLVRRVDVIICSTSAAERVRALGGSSVQVILDDRALDQRAIEMLADLLVRQDGAGAAASVSATPTRPGLRSSSGRERRRGVTRAAPRES
jgi:GntR family transcriptional regulator